MSFGYELYRLARAADDVDDDVIDKVRSLVSDYVDRGLAVKHVDVMQYAPVNNVDGLSVKPNDARADDRSFSIRDPNNNFTCQVALAYDRNKSLWVLAQDRGPLVAADGYVDQWSQEGDALPAYAPPPVEDLEAKTSIILPLRISPQNIVGVLCLDSVQAVEMTDNATAELQRVADALAVLYSKHDSTSRARKLRENAIGELQDTIPDSPRLTVPHVFVASSSDADPAVIDAITSVLKRYESKGKITWAHWSDNYESGPVAPELLEDIKRARVGICYLSEPIHDAEAATAYRDNLNVLFEAGMFHRHGDGGRWVPVREQDSPPPPFNLQDLNTVFVPRDASGNLDAPELTEELSNFVQALID